MSTAAGLPDDRHVDVGKLASLFAKTTNSYKFLFFLGLLEVTRGWATTSSPCFTTRQVLEAALAIAWFPHSYFRLSFGPQDQIGRVLDELAPHLPRLPGTLTPDDVKSMRAALGRALNQDQALELLRYVPSRLLSPWFEPELRGMPDHRKDDALARLSNERFRSNAPLYRLEDDRRAIQLHPDWWGYLWRNRRVIEDWTRWNWLLYMQARNPSTLNVGGKLLPPLERAPLSRQRDFWAKYIAHRPLQCIYTGQVLAPKAALDHFLPWSFVLHDRWWNLVPVGTSTNSAKRDSLPDLDHYLGALVDVHASALVVSRDWLGQDQWRRIALEYSEDLGAPLAGLEGRQDDVRDVLHSGYRKVLPTLMGLARIQGFPDSWRAREVG